MNRPLSQSRWPQWLAGAISIIVVLVLYLLSAELIGQAFAFLRPVSVPLLLSLAVSYLLEPLVVWIERKLKWSKSIAAMIAVVAGMLAFFFLLIVLLPPIVAQLVVSVQSLPAALRALTTALQPWLESLHDRYPATYASVVDSVNAYLSDTSHFTDPLLNSLTGGLKQAVGIGSSILNMILVPMFTFYILTDYSKLRDGLESLIPHRHRRSITPLIDRIERVTSTFVRGQLLVALILSLLYVVGFFVARVPLALSLGILAGFGYLIPYIGTWVAVVLTLLITVLGQPSWVSVLGIAGVYLMVQLIEGFILTPKLLGGRLQLHPMLVILGLIVGGSQFGIFGVILAMPVLAILKVIVEVLSEPYRRSRFFNRPATEPDETGQLG